MSPSNGTGSPQASDGPGIRTTLISLAGELLEMSKKFEPKKEQLFALESDIVLKAKAFIAVAQSPLDYSTATISSVMGSAVVRTLTHMKVLQAIPCPECATAETVADATGAQTSLVERLLRAAVSLHFLSYDAQTHAFKHTHLSIAWAQPHSPAEDFFTFCYNGASAPMVLLPDWLNHNDPNRPSEPIGDTANTHNPLTYRHGTEGKTSFETLAQHPEDLAVFSRILKAAANLKPFTGLYPWERLADPDPARPLFVDIGGSTGHAIAAILVAHPDLPASGFVLQDLPNVIDLARDTASLPADVGLQVHDFFTPNPVKGGQSLPPASMSARLAGRGVRADFEVRRGRYGVGFEAFDR